MCVGTDGEGDRVGTLHEGGVGRPYHPHPVLRTALIRFAAQPRRRRARYYTRRPKVDSRLVRTDRALAWRPEP